MLARRRHAIKLEFPPLQQLLLDCLRGLGAAPGLEVDLHRTPSIIHTPAGGMLGTGRGGHEAHLNHERLRDVLPEPLELPGSILHLFHLEHKLQQAAAALFSLARASDSPTPGGIAGKHHAMRGADSEGRTQLLRSRAGSVLLHR